MSISKKVLSLFMSIFVLVTTIAFTNPFASKVLADELPVKLYYSHAVAESRDFGHYTGYIAVKNLAYDKKVTVHYEYNNGAWNDVAASYVKTNSSDGYEVWEFQTPDKFDYSQMQFAIKYEVNGQTYWDNNNGKNYEGDDFNADMPLVNGYSEYDKNVLNVDIETKKSANPEAVKVRYTEDNWATFKDIDAVNTWNDDIGMWVAKLPVLSSTKQVKFAVYYVSNGVKYWDNNLGDNYTFNN